MPSPKTVALRTIAFLLAAITAWSLQRYYLKYSSLKQEIGRKNLQLSEAKAKRDYFRAERDRYRTETASLRNQLRVRELPVEGDRSLPVGMANTETTPINHLRHKLVERFDENREREAIQGLDDWLFLPGEIECANLPYFEFAQSVPSIVSLDRELKVRGITLVLCIVPAKWEIYPEKLDSDFPGQHAPANPAYHALIDELHKWDVLAPNLSSTFLEAKSGDDLPLYFPQDTHWTPRASRLAAKAIAETLPQSFRKSEKPPGAEPSPSDLQSVTKVGGDLLDMLKAGNRTLPKTTYTTSISYRIPKESPDSDTWLVGASNTLDVYGLPAALADELHLDSVHHELIAMRDLVSRERGQPSPFGHAKLIIWTGPFRYLPGDHFYVPATTAHQWTQGGVPEFQTLDIASVSDRPKPEKLVYPDFLSYLISTDGALIYFQSVKNRKLIFNSWPTSGQVANGKLTRWSEVLRDRPGIASLACESSPLDLSAEVFFLDSPSFSAKGDGQ
ncbi:MAG TPA: hypothetical protein P5016_04330 [Verrucomicrobiales bacterium]|mgnify:CR=1 FL=1|nr:hypothetical protein [Verrucomicrobiae bacterium]HRX53709.1 hypothetical protein [Verrucomicrobiales bacterium]